MKSELVLLDILRRKFGKYHYGLGEIEREVHVVVNRANYSWPTSAIIELNGSPPRFSLYIDFYYSWDSSSGRDQHSIEYNTTVVLGGVSLRKSKKRTELINIIFNFLEDGGYLDDARRF